MAVNGTAGKDFIHVAGDGRMAPGGYLDNPGATNAADIINIQQGGNDIVFAGSGDDTIKLGAVFTENDQIDGESGADKIILDGDYSLGVIFKATTMVNVEQVVMAAGHDYSLKSHDANVAAGTTTTFDASALGAADSLTFDGTRETNAILLINGGAGKDVMKGGGFANGYHLETGGNDTATGSIGADGFYMAGAFTAKDKLNGGGGPFDTVFLDGNYAAGVVFGAKTVTNTANLEMAAGHNYALTIHENTVAAGASMTFDASELGAGNRLTFDGSADTDCFSIVINGGAGNDTIVGGHSNVMNLATGGIDDVTGGDAHDQFFFGTTFTTADSVDGGGDATDLLIISTGVPVAMMLGAAQVKNIETLQTGGNYTITAQDNLVAAGATMAVQGPGYSGSDVLSFDGSAETNGTYSLNGGLGADTLVGGAGNDTLKGFEGKDVLTGGGGADTYAYGIHLAAESTGPTCDVITGFDFGNDDKFDLAITVSGVETAITTGNLSFSTFDTDMAAAVSALGANHAVLFTPSGGTLAGRTFLVIDGNLSGGYQGGTDYVMELVSAAHTNGMDTSDFI